ncbi:MAG TPA: cytochrome c3 family protein [Candidatus Xenobia bacterium]|nr:cytochrome c3 family protein [Candidatus Xenobia bacterium]
MRVLRIGLLALLALGFAGVGFSQSPTAAPPAALTTDTCVSCHSTLGDEPAAKFTDDIHHARGLSCAACHGGDPTSDDMRVSMSPARGFRGKPSRQQIPQLCARCHSDAALMRGYNPSLRTDQLAQYLTSIHGKRLAQGDTRVAVCTDCHSVHDIRPASNPLSSVHPLRIPQTCAHCHADAERMKPYKIATDQFTEYRASVHYEKLEAGDLAAPTCATCHGNHGAAPPGVASVERVCGTCHVFQEQLFNESPHKQPWEKVGFAACSTCHGNHRIEHTRDALVGTTPEAVCTRCHSEGDAGWTTAEKISAQLNELETSLQGAVQLMDRVERAGMEVGEARLALANAQEKLIKARVDVHAFNAARVEATVSSGLEFTAQARKMGKEALAELAFRRRGLALSLIIIAWVVLSLWLLIRHLERRSVSEQNVSRR